MTDDDVVAVRATFRGGPYDGKVYPAYRSRDSRLWFQGRLFTDEALYEWTDEIVETAEGPAYLAEWVSS